MLDVWTTQPADVVKEFCSHHEQATGEALNPTTLRLYFCSETPYPGYSLARLELDPQVIRRGSATQSISSRCISYALYATGTTASTHWKLIPMRRDAANVYHTNSLLGFRTTNENLLSYLLYIGHLFYNPPFYFFSKLSHLDQLIAHLPQDTQSRVRSAVEAAFKVLPNGELVLHVKEQSYPLLGRTFTVEVPCFHAGGLYIAKLRVAEDGTPEMLEDRALQIEGIFDEEPNYNYYHLDFPNELADALATNQRKFERASILVVSALRVDAILQVWMLPLFVFHLFVMLAHGLSTPVVDDYFNALRASTTLLVLSWILGSLGVAIATFRYAFLEATNYLRKIVPSVWSWIAAATEREAKTQAKQLGYVGFVVLNGAEHFLRTFMSLSLLLYALSNSSLLPPMNFGEATIAVLSNVPLLGDYARAAFASSPFASPTLPDLSGKLISGLVGFLFTTVAVGILVRLLLLARKED
ncbi:MAG: hypothetical protein KA144_01330 [Xanthomonadaceae bacterium]|nr:hypothetical protein [Xanthomonadaceae bacterium]